MILVTGATGHVGGEVARRLLSAGDPTRVLVRDAAKGERLGQDGAEVVVGSFDDLASLDAALAGTDKVFLVSAYNAEQVAQEAAVIDAAARAGRPHVVKLGVLGQAPDSPLRIARAHAEITEHLRDSGLPHTVLTPNAFMQNLLFSAETIREQGAFYGGYGDGAVSYVDVADVGAVAAHVLSSDGHEGAVYAPTGPAALTAVQVAAAISAALGREVRYVELPADQLRQGMLGAGMPEWNVDGLLELYADYRRGAAPVVTDEVEKATGRPARSLADFLADNRAAFG